MFAKTISILEHQQVAKLTTAKLNQVKVFHKRAEAEDIEPSNFNSLAVVLDKSIPEEKVKAVETALSEGVVKARLTQSLSIGNPFADYGEISNVFDDGKTALKHSEGEVLLVDVWATWCGPCQDPMQHNQDMLVKNKEAWEAKVRIVAVSVDDQKEDIKKRVEDKKWNDIVHLTLGGWDGEHKLVKDFSIQGIPFICLINKFGKIDYLGHPSQIKLEDRINELLAQEVPVQQNQPVITKSSWEEKHTEELAKIISLDNVKQTFSESEVFLVHLRQFSTYTKGSTDVKVNLKVGVYEGQTQGLLKLKTQLETAGLTQHITIEQNIVKTIEVPNVQKPICWECSQNLQYPYYWLKWEEGEKFGCRKCVEAPSTEENHHYKYEKNSVYLTGEVKKLAVKGLGSNIQPQSPQKVVNIHFFYCNGCDKGSLKIGEPRYICLGCRNDPNPKGDFIDLCLACFEKLNEKNEEVLTKLKPDNHKDNHPLIRILYNVKGYAEY